MDPARERILSRIRLALRTPAVQPPEPATVAVFPPVTDLLATFVREFSAVKGELVRDLAAFLARYRRVASAVPQVEGDYDAREAELGVSGCDCLVAQTGTVVLNARLHGGRAVSVLPPAHLVLARQDQIVPDLAAALRLLQNRYRSNWPSQLVFITGPSRTADIEKVLVMGAHGPKQLALYFTD